MRFSSPANTTKLWAPYGSAPYRTLPMVPLRMWTGRGLVCHFGEESALAGQAVARELDCTRIRTRFGTPHLGWTRCMTPWYGARDRHDSCMARL